jgi:peroxiredoxin
MKPLLLFTAFIAVTLSSFSKAHEPKPGAIAILNKVMWKLNHLKSVSYTYKRILDYPDEAYHDEMVIDAYLDFAPAAQLIGLRYQFSNKDILSIYNGSETFYCDKKEKTIVVDNSPIINSFKSSAVLFNSPVSVKNALSAIITDETTPKLLYDTIITNRKFYVVNVILKNKTLNSLGDYEPTTVDLKFSYKIIIDKTTFMPVEILQHTLKNKDINRTLFTNINFNPVPKTETSWYSSSYDNYTLQKPTEKTELIKANALAPDSRLTFFNSQKATSINDFKGNVVLLVFWIKDCGHCIEDVPQLNRLYDKYKGRNFKLLGINTHDTKAMINFFVNKHHIKYDVLTGANTIDKDYGIYGFPAIVMVDKNSKVIYAGYGLDLKKLQVLIDQNI